ncbi:MAG: MarR family transcriptional regulator [Devosiaceae bacterium]|nr:MarR family transcriptional regulator [Devosiaceae bacterium]
MFDENLGKIFGSNRTDGRCADIIQRFGRLTAGELAEQTGLTTGAITTIIDRLEKSGVARRIRDKSDRRKVYVELTEFAKEMVNTMFAPMGEVFGQAMNEVPLEDVRVIAQYLEFTERMNKAYAEVLTKHGSKSGASKKERLLCAKGFAQDVRDINPSLADTWGQTPADPPQTGKSPSIDFYDT